MRLRLLSIAVLAAAVASCEPSAPPGPSYPAEQTYAASLGVDLSTFVKVDTNLYYKDLVVGTGATASAASTVTIAYTGYLVDGTSFDNSADYTSALTQLIAGWQIGVPGMKIGGTRRLVIGSNYGYGSQDKGTIPPRSTLVFDIQLKALH